LIRSLSLTSLYYRFVKAHTRLVSFVKPDKKYSHTTKTCRYMCCSHISPSASPIVVVLFVLCLRSHDRRTPDWSLVVFRQIITPTHQSTETSEMTICLLMQKKTQVAILAIFLKAKGLRKSFVGQQMGVVSTISLTKQDYGS
jgi:hypothetical protein